MTGTVITIKEIRGWFEAAFDSVELLNGAEVEVNGSYYWDVNFWDAFNVSTEPHLGLGDVFDDIHDIRSDLANPLEERSIYAFHTLAHLRGILTLLAAQQTGDLHRQSKPERSV